MSQTGQWIMPYVIPHHEEVVDVLLTSGEVVRCEFLANSALGKTGFLSFENMPRFFAKDDVENWMSVDDQNPGGQ